MRVFTVPSFNVLSGCFYVSLTLVAALPVWILINFVKQLLLVKPICSYFFPEGWHTRLMRGLRCARSRVRPPVRSHPCFNFSWNTLKTEHWWREVCVEGKEGRRRGKIRAPSTSSLSVVTVTSCRRKIRLLYLYLHLKPMVNQWCQRHPT